MFVHSLMLFVHLMLLPNCVASVLKVAQEAAEGYHHLFAWFRKYVKRAQRCDERTKCRTNYAWQVQWFRHRVVAFVDVCDISDESTNFVAAVSDYLAIERSKYCDGQQSRTYTHVAYLMTIVYIYIFGHLQRNS